MTLDQLVAEVAAQPTQVKAFETFMECLKIEADDVFAGDSMPPSLKTKYDGVFSGASGKAAEILNAIETGKPALEPVKKPVVSPSDPSGPTSSVKPTTFVDKTETAPPSKAAEPKPVLEKA